MNRPKCTINHSMKGKLIIVTGASSGVGKSTAFDLLEHDAHVVFACRNESKVKAIISSLPESQQKNASFVRINLSDFDSIIAFCKEIKEKYPKIDILMNNAGELVSEYKVTKDGFESVIESNYWGILLLTYSLLDHFNTEEAKIINVSSQSHLRSSLTVDNLKDFMTNEMIKEKFYPSMRAKLHFYESFKLMQNIFTIYLNDFCTKKYPHIKVACLHPGRVFTDFGRMARETIRGTIFYIVCFFTRKLFSLNLKEGAQTQLYMCPFLIKNL